MIGGHGAAVARMLCKHVTLNYGMQTCIRSGVRDPVSPVFVLYMNFFPFIFCIFLFQNDRELENLRFHAVPGRKC